MFIFQANDGIRDIGVTGVQTCALPISTTSYSAMEASMAFSPWRNSAWPSARRSLVGACCANGSGGFILDRESVVLGKSVVLGGRRIINKKKLIFAVIRLPSRRSVLRSS